VVSQFQQSRSQKTTTGGWKGNGIGGGPEKRLGEGETVYLQGSLGFECVLFQKTETGEKRRNAEGSFSQS